ncbi:MAG: hypothetical protein K5769_04800 [Pseudobutyrivibrio sp.]|nr:hypothetical protein [Pseudobutyrivibrio sp.]
MPKPNNIHEDDREFLNSTIVAGTDDSVLFSNPKEDCIEKCEENIKLLKGIIANIRILEMYHKNDNANLHNTLKNYIREYKRYNKSLDNLNNKEFNDVELANKLTTLINNNIELKRVRNMTINHLTETFKELISKNITLSNSIANTYLTFDITQTDTNSRIYSSDIALMDKFSDRYKYLRKKVSQKGLTSIKYRKEILDLMKDNEALTAIHEDMRRGLMPKHIKENPILNSPEQARFSGPYPNSNSSGESSITNTPTTSTKTKAEYGRNAYNKRQGLPNFFNFKRG